MSIIMADISVNHNLLILAFLVQLRAVPGKVPEP